MDLITFVKEYWYLIVGGLTLLLIYFRYSNNKSVGDLEKSDIALLLESGIYFLLIITIQDTFFNEHVFFILTLCIFIPIWALVIYHILNRGNYYLIESRIQGQEFYEMKLIDENPQFDKTVTNQTAIRIHIMDKEVFENTEHFGNDFSPRYNVGNRIKFCDYFNGKMIYHPIYPEIENISFWARIVEFVHYKDLVTDLIRENLELTDLGNVRIYKNIQTIRNNLKTTLTGLESQWAHNPYSIQDKLKEYLESKIAESHKAQTENESETAEKQTVENKEGGNNANQ